MTPYGHRRRNLPAPPHVVWDDLADPARTGSRVWLHPGVGEVRPRVLAGERPHSLVWSSLWVARPEDRLAFALEPREAGTSLTFTLMAAGEPPDESTTGHLRHRVNRLLWADLRFSYGQ